MIIHDADFRNRRFDDDHDEAPLEVRCAWCDEENGVLLDERVVVTHTICERHAKAIAAELVSPSKSVRSADARLS
jgi:hypothetical protein